MKLSEAIRLGAMVKPQGFGRNSNGKTTCAYHAATEAIGFPASGGKIYAAWSFSGVFSAACPADDGCDRDADAWKNNTLAHLNDKHRWTRERIADWVETIEAAQAAPIERPVAVTVP